MLMNQTSLKTLYRLRNLSELHCYSNIDSEFFHQLSQTCYYIRTLKIYFQRTISSGLSDLISVQQNLKYLKIFDPHKHRGYLTKFLENNGKNLSELYICIYDSNGNMS